MDKPTQEQREAEAISRGERSKLALEHYEGKLKAKRQAYMSNFINTLPENLVLLQTKVKVIDELLSEMHGDVKQGERAVKRARGRQS